MLQVEHFENVTFLGLSHLDCLIKLTVEKTYSVLQKSPLDRVLKNDIYLLHRRLSLLVQLRHCRHLACSNSSGHYNL